MVLFIEKIVPNYISNLLRGFDDSTGEQALSGFVTGSIVPHTFLNDEKNGFNSGELYDSRTYLILILLLIMIHHFPKFPKPASCEKVNVAGVNDAIEKLIREVEAIKTGITGDDSFLVTAQQFGKDVKAGI